MQIATYTDAVDYLESFIGNVVYKIDKEYLKHHDPLERLKILLSLLGNPQEKFKSILVGGTSGKGSTSYLISHILTTAGYKTGLTLSPHLQKVNERLQINGKAISDEEFVKLLNSVKPAIEKMEGPPARHREALASAGGPSYFEILIAMAFKYFACPPSLRSGAGRRADQKVDIAVVEVGMGGEFDATNTLNPLVAVLTNVGLDHTNILGKTVEKIAKTKAGIIKKINDLRLKIKESKENHKSSIINRQSLIVVTGVKQSSVIKIVEDRCRKVGAKLFRLGKDFDFRIKKESREGSVFDLISAHDREVKLNDLRISLLGDYQVENASLAIETVSQLADFGFKISENDIRKALRTSFFPGRFEVVHFKGSPHSLNDSSEPIGNTQKVDEKTSLYTAELLSKSGSVRPVKRAFRGETRPTLILDGAHNPVKMKEFLKNLKKIFPKEKKIFIIGFKFDKDIKKMLKEIVKVADEIIITEFNRATDMGVGASADALNIKDQILKIKKNAKVTVEKDSGKALKKGIKTIQQYNKSAILVITGSLYLVGEIRNML